MLNRLKSWAIAWALVLSTAQFCSAAGFAIYEWSARGNALGGATVGRADDPSALASNPAGITQLDGLQVLAGFTAIHPVLDIRTGDKWTTSDEDSLWVPPHIYATWKVNDRYSIGLGTFSRFGLGSVFDEDWEGRYNSYEAVIQSVSVNPNVAVKVTDNLSAAFGVDATYLDITMKKKLNFSSLGPLPDGDADLQADGMGYGFNMALHYQPCQYAKLGLSYRSPVTMKVNGDADFSDIPSGLVGAGFFHDTSASGTVTLPDSFAFGVAMYPTEKLSVELGAVYTLWSKYDELKINYGSPLVTSAGPATQTVTPKNWSDVWRFNIGVEYAALDWLDLRAGYVFDQSPLNDDTIDYLVPANDRHLLNGGLGFHWDNWTVDLNYTYLMIMDRDIDARNQYADGSYEIYEGEIDNADAHMVGLSVGYKF